MIAHVSDLLTVLAGPAWRDDDRRPGPPRSIPSRSANRIRARWSRVRAAVGVSPSTPPACAGLSPSHATSSTSSRSPSASASNARRISRHPGVLGSAGEAPCLGRGQPLHQRPLASLPTTMVAQMVMRHGEQPWQRRVASRHDVEAPPGDLIRRRDQILGVLPNQPPVPRIPRHGRIGRIK